MRLVRLPHVVDEHVDAAERVERLAHRLLRRARLGEVGRDAERGADLRPHHLDPLRPPPAHDDLRALGGEQPRGLEADPAGRAGDDADTPAEAQIHAASLTSRDRDPARPPRRDGVEPPAPLAGPHRHAAQRDRPRSGARARAHARRRARRRRLLERPEPRERDGCGDRGRARPPGPGRPGPARDRRRRPRGAHARGGRAALPRRRLGRRDPGGARRARARARCTGSPSATRTDASSSSATAARSAARRKPLWSSLSGPIGNCATWAVRLRDGTLLAVD